MTIEVLKSKIHRVTVTEADLDYIGSITIDEALMEAANIIENEKVDIYNITNGERRRTRPLWAAWSSSPAMPAWTSRRPNTGPRR